jgi:hypothetical protein
MVRSSHRWTTDGGFATLPQQNPARLLPANWWQNTCPKGKAFLVP